MIRWSLSNRLPLLARGALPGGWGLQHNRGLATLDAGLDGLARVAVDAGDIVLADIATAGGGSAALARRVQALPPGVEGALLHTASGPKLQHIANRSTRSIRLAGPMAGPGVPLRPGHAGWFMATAFDAQALNAAAPQLLSLVANPAAALQAGSTALALRLAAPARLLAWAVAGSVPGGLVLSVQLRWQRGGGGLPDPPAPVILTSRIRSQRARLADEPALPAGTRIDLAIAGAVPAPVPLALSLLLLPMEGSDG